MNHVCWSWSRPECNHFDRVNSDAFDSHFMLVIISLFVFDRYSVCITAVVAVFLYQINKYSKRLWSAKELPEDLSEIEFIKRPINLRMCEKLSAEKRMHLRWSRNQLVAIDSPAIQNRFIWLPWSNNGFNVFDPRHHCWTIIIVNRSSLGTVVLYRYLCNNHDSTLGFNKGHTSSDHLIFPQEVFSPRQWGFNMWGSAPAAPGWLGPEVILSSLMISLYSPLSSEIEKL